MEDTKKCYKGWNDLEHNKDGACCCNCKYNKPVMCHPWNTFGKGMISQQIEIEGKLLFVCCGQDNAILFDREHGMCETHAFKGE